MRILEINGLKVEANGKEIVHGLDLAIEEGETHVIMGQNGSGKSTFLSAIAGNPKYKCSGRIAYCGKDLDGEKPHERSRKGIFLAFQSPIEVPGVSLSSFLKRAHAARNGKEISIAEFARLMDEKRAMLGMGQQFLERGVNEGFSGGEKKMSELLQMAVLEPKLAMLDEPDSGLDVDALARVGKAIAKVKREDGAMIIVTHSSKLIRGIKVDKVHVMHNGKIVASGDERLAHKIEEKGYGWVLG
jgi:Fe-S cluster assembly ATP-binding protein